MNSQKTVLYNTHVRLNGNIITFSGYLLPTHYSSIKEEHSAVRNFAGLFDVSHMGELIIEGSKAEEFINYISTNSLANLSYGQAQYSVICNDRGGILDDVLIYKKQESFMIVVNASNKKKIFNWLKLNAIKDIRIYDASDKIGLLALQGPNSLKILEKTFNLSLSGLSYYNFIEIKINNLDVLISRTGYTGELGFELYINNNYIKNIWNDLISFGSNLGLLPAGLASRDMLRLEMNYNLYGNDIDEDINPLEAGLDWVVKFNKKNFIGKNALLKIRGNLTYISVCLEMKEKSIPRKGYTVFLKNKKIGHVTSGTMSLSQKKGIAKAIIKKEYSKIGNNILVDIRGKKKKAIIVASPFYKAGSLSSNNG